jgi:hypothetical protein
MENPRAPSDISWSQFKLETIEHESEAPDNIVLRAASNFL